MGHWVRALRRKNRSGNAPKPQDCSDPAAGLPPDLARVLRDQSVVVPMDGDLWAAIESWRNAPSNTASGGDS